MAMGESIGASLLRAASETSRCLVRFRSSTSCSNAGRMMEETMCYERLR